MSKRSRFPERVRSRDVLTGPWMSIPYPMVVEMLAQTGPDFLLIDGEHAPIAPQTLPVLLPAAERQDMPVIYRVAWNRIELIKAALEPAITDYLVWSHMSSEPGAAAILGKLAVRPLLQLDLRLGEGTGAVLAVPILRAALAMMREMATFASAGVSGPGE